MRKGVLRKGFTIYTNSSSFTIPPNTEVLFTARSIFFMGYDVVLTEEDGRWYAYIYGQKHQMQFDVNNPPYPISYYCNRKAVQVPAS
ncbi:MAG: hypothetical protein QXI42_11125 [Thermoproteota archaeon]